MCNRAVCVLNRCRLIGNRCVSLQPLIVPNTVTNEERAQPMSEDVERLESALHSLVEDVLSTTAIESKLEGKPVDLRVVDGIRLKKRSADCSGGDAPVPHASDPMDLAKRVTHSCKKKRAVLGNGVACDTSDREIARCSVFTDKFNLQPYEYFLHYVPRIVNTVTLAEAIPVEGSGMKLPLDLQRIASLCKNSYYAPKKFSAVQLAYSEPRSRVLVFHTGRLVGTGALRSLPSARL